MNRKASEILSAGKQLLKNAGCESVGFDASCIFEHCFGMSRTDVITSPDTILDDSEFMRLCQTRAGGYPLQYILGSWEFMGLEFELNRNVLIPRPDTETVVEQVIALGGRRRYLDMCTGSGCIGISLAHYIDGAEVTLADVSDGALEIAKRNADKNGVDVSIVKADLTDGYEKYFKKHSFDIIVSNPPYIKSGDAPTLSREVLHEPHIALFGGEDGLKFYSALINLWKDALTPLGIMVLESGYDTWQDICRLFERAGYTDIVTKRDIGGNVRAVCARVTDGK